MDLRKFSGYMADYFSFLVQTKYRKGTLFLVGNVDGRDFHRVARRCGTGRRCSVSGQQHGHPKISALRSEHRSSRDHTRAPKMSLALAMVITMNTRRFQRTHPFVEWEIICSTRQRILMWELLTLRLLVNQIQ